MNVRKPTQIGFIPKKKKPKTAQAKPVNEKTEERNNEPENKSE